MTDYNDQHSSFREYCPKWQLVDDVVRSRVKEKGTEYLPKPNPDDLSQRNKLAYENYKKRAVFYNFTKPTQMSLLGAMFRKKPVIEASGLDYLETNIDGSGLTIEQQAKDAARELTETSRGLFFVDFSATEPAANRREEREQGKRPVAIFYKACSIINWETSVKNNLRVLSKVVLAEREEVDVQHSKERVIFLNENGLCQIDLNHYKEGLLVGTETTIPTNSQGSPLNYLPVQFVGGLNNDESIDDSMLYDLATLNVAHYQSSADYEDFRYKLGQVQPVLTGLSAADIEKNNGKLMMGAGTAWVFGEGAQATLLQASPNTASYESMKHKEEQAKAIGAKLLDPKLLANTATESSRLSSNEGASIVTIIDNLESAYRSVFEMILDRVQAGSIEIEFSREFTQEQAMPDELRVLSDMAFKGQIPESILFRRFKEIGYISDELTFEEWQSEIAANPSGLGLNA